MVLQRPCAVVVRLRSLRKDSQIASGLVNASVHIAATSRSVTLDSASNGPRGSLFTVRAGCRTDAGGLPVGCGDRKSTRLNSSHVSISYAVFCLKKKNKHMLAC